MLMCPSFPPTCSLDFLQKVQCEAISVHEYHDHLIPHQKYYQEQLSCAFHLILSPSSSPYETLRQCLVNLYGMG